jgi:hypothetical protein
MIQYSFGHHLAIYKTLSLIKIQCYSSLQLDCEHLESNGVIKLEAYRASSS